LHRSSPRGLARRGPGFGVFGSRPGAYGAGLQALIDERGWETSADLARAYVAWGGYAYGSGSQGVDDPGPVGEHGIEPVDSSRSWGSRWRRAAARTPGVGARTAAAAGDEYT